MSDEFYGAVDHEWVCPDCGHKEQRNYLNWNEQCFMCRQEKMAETFEKLYDKHKSEKALKKQLERVKTKQCKVPTVKSLHPLAEKVNCLLFGIETAPAAEQKRMKERAVKYIHKYVTQGDIK